MIDKKEAIKLVAGTVARGLMWAIGLLCQISGFEMATEQRQQTAEGLALLIAGTLVEFVAVWWSTRKDRKLLARSPV